MDRVAWWNGPGEPCVGDDIEIYRDETRTHVLTVSHHLRQQTGKSVLPTLADFVARNWQSGLHPFAVTGGLEGGCAGEDAFEAPTRRLQQGSWRAALPTVWRKRLPVSACEGDVRKVCTGDAEREPGKRVIRENYPSAGYPACPEHTEKALSVAAALDVEKHTGMKLTESFAMWLWRVGLRLVLQPS